MEELVLFLAMVLAAWATLGAARRSRVKGAPGTASQIGVGLACGTIGALAASIPHADVVPDGLEPILTVALFAVLTATVAVTVIRRSMARQRHVRLVEPTAPPAGRTAQA